MDGKNTKAYQTLISKTNTGRSSSQHRVKGIAGISRQSLINQTGHMRAGSIGLKAPDKSKAVRNITTAAPMRQSANNINIMMQGSDTRGLIAARKTQGAYVAASEKRIISEKERTTLQTKKNSEALREPHIHSGLSNTYDVNTHVMPELGETEFMKRKFDGLDFNQKTQKLQAKIPTAKADTGSINSAKEKFVIYTRKS